MGSPPGWMPPIPNSYASSGASFPPFMPPPPWVGGPPVPHAPMPDAPYVNANTEKEEEEEGGEVSIFLLRLRLFFS